MTVARVEYREGIFASVHVHFHAFWEIHGAVVSPRGALESLWSAYLTWRKIEFTPNDLTSYAHRFETYLAARVRDQRDREHAARYGLTPP